MTANNYIIASSQGHVWNMETDRPTTFKLLSDQTEDSIAVFEEVVPVGGGTPFHIHHTSDETIFIAAGEFIFKIGENISTCTTGTWVFIPRGMAHAWKNSGDKAGRAFYIFTPAEGAKVFEALRLLNLPIPEIDASILEKTCRQYGYELVGPPPF